MSRAEISDDAWVVIGPLFPLPERRAVRLTDVRLSTSLLTSSLTLSPRHGVRT